MPPGWSPQLCGVLLSGLDLAGASNLFTGAAARGLFDSTHLSHACFEVAFTTHESVISLAEVTEQAAVIAPGVQAWAVLVRSLGGTSMLRCNS